MRVVAKRVSLLNGRVLVLDLIQDTKRKWSVRRTIDGGPPVYEDQGVSEGEARASFKWTDDFFSKTIEILNEDRPNTDTTITISGFVTTHEQQS